MKGMISENYVNQGTVMFSFILWLTWYLIKQNVFLDIIITFTKGPTVHLLESAVYYDYLT